MTLTAHATRPCIIYPASVLPPRVDAAAGGDVVTLDKWFVPLSLPDFATGERNRAGFIATIPFSVGEEDRNPEATQLDKWYTPLSQPLFAVPPTPQAPYYTEVFAATIPPPPTALCPGPSRRVDESPSLPQRPDDCRDRR